jgi:predicted CoA-substrate-specific enzyme activase
MISQGLFAGVDVGASRTKAVLLDGDKKIVGHGVQRSGTDFSAASQACLSSALEMAGAEIQDIVRAVSTGYGRKNVALATTSKTEIACHGAGCYHYFPYAITIIDIGGQDNKVIKLDQNGLRTNFKMNRKCAAGTGAFLEEMALRLDIPLENMNDMARRSQNMVKLGSYCTVFSGTEVLQYIRNGKKVSDIVKGLFFSVIKRIMEMDPLTQTVVMTGGVVAHNPFLVTMAQEIIGRPVLVTEHPQLTGALGAALFALHAQNQ